MWASAVGLPGSWFPMRCRDHEDCPYHTSDSRSFRLFVLFSFPDRVKSGLDQSQMLECFGLCQEITGCPDRGLIGQFTLGNAAGTRCLLCILKPRSCILHGTALFRGISESSLRNASSAASCAPIQKPLGMGPAFAEGRRGRRSSCIIVSTEVDDVVHAFSHNDRPARSIGAGNDESLATVNGTACAGSTTKLPCCSRPRQFITGPLLIAR